MTRLFVAVELPPALRARLAEVPARLGAHGWRFVDEAQMHLTLRFLGDVDDALVDDLAARIERAVAPLAPFDVDVGGAGTFGRRGAPHVLWVGVSDPQARLAALADAVDAALDPLAGPRDRPFAAHITLGRAKGRARGRDGGASPPAHRDASAQRSASLGRVNLRAPGVDVVGALRVDAVVLFESVQGAHGTVHTARATVHLGGHAPLVRSSGPSEGGDQGGAT